MSIIYYPLSTTVNQRTVSGSAYTELSLDVVPNIVFFFNTSSQLDYASASIFPYTTSFAVSASIAYSASTADTSSWAVNAINGGTQLSTASTYPITSSWAERSSTSSFLPVGTYQITSSWATNATNAGTSSLSILSDTASYISGSITFADSANNFFPVWSDNNLSSTSSLHYSASALYLDGGTGSLIGTASWANTASYAYSAIGTASWATSASYAYSASYEIMIEQFASSSMSSSWASSSLSSSRSVNADSSSYPWHPTGSGNIATVGNNVGVGTESPQGLFHVATTDITDNIVATGGTKTYSGPYTIHTFSTPGSSSFDILAGIGYVEYLVIAGGGGGGTINAGNSGGGGAGGYRSSVIGESSGGGAAAEATIQLSSGSYTVVVGAGGVGGTSTPTDPSEGQNSFFNTIHSIGGGHGGWWTSGVATAGGSGGGGGQGGTNVGGAGIAGQGYKGGDDLNRYGAAGGGGASQSGSSPYGGGNNPEGGYGGNGVTSSITGTPVVRAGGGAGSAHGSATGGVPQGGAGGGGNGHYGATLATSGVDGTGGGGGGGGENITPSGDGGDGIVIIRYYTPVAGTGLTVKSSGNVGISTINPVNLLDVVGNISCSVITASLLGTASYANFSNTASSAIFASESFVTDNVSVTPLGSGEYPVAFLGSNAGIVTVHADGNSLFAYDASNTQLAVPAITASGITASILTFYAPTASVHAATASIGYTDNGNGTDFMIDTNGVARWRFDSSGEIYMNNLSGSNIWSGDDQRCDFYAASTLISGSGEITTGRVTASFFTGRLYGTSSYADFAGTSSYANKSDAVPFNYNTSSADGCPIAFGPFDDGGVYPGYYNVIVGTAKYYPASDTLKLANVSASCVTASLKGTASWAENLTGSGYTGNIYILDGDATTQHSMSFVCGVLTSYTKV